MLFVYCGPKVSEELENYLGQLSGGEVELKEASLRYTIDILASTGFGMQTNSFKDPDNKFKDMVSNDAFKDGGISQVL